MGDLSSKETNEQKVYETDGTKLLSAYDLFLQKYDIENLAFGNGGARALAYSGAVKVLELIGVLENVKRFAGVGTGALIAALLALGFKSSDIYKYFNKHLEALALDEKDGHSYPSICFYKHVGVNSGKKFLDCFTALLETKSYDSKLSFWQLYQSTNIELCILVNYIGKRSTIYCHPKTTPDMPISRAIMLSLSIPGFYLPQKYITGHQFCLSEDFECSYPIHVFDGWYLSMDSENSFLNKLGSSSKSLDKFDSKNPKTIGFMFIEYQDENQTELVDRLSSAQANINIPATTLGLEFEKSKRTQLTSETDYFILRKACKKLFHIAEDIADDDGLVCEEQLATQMFKDDVLGIEFRTKLLPSDVCDKESCASYLRSLRDGEPELYVDSIKDYFENKARSLLKASSASNDQRMGIPGFSNMANIYRKDSFKLSKYDYDRTAGILSRYIGINDANLELEDRHFLYTQGWNATVALLRQFSYTSKESDPSLSP